VLLAHLVTKPNLKRALTHRAHRERCIDHAHPLRSSERDLRAHESNAGTARRNQKNDKRTGSPPQHAEITECFLTRIRL
jgi:hypothetical protein